VATLSGAQSMGRLVRSARRLITSSSIKIFGTPSSCKAVSPETNMHIGMRCILRVYLPYFTHHSVPSAPLRLRASRCSTYRKAVKSFPRDDPVYRFLIHCSSVAYQKAKSIFVSGRFWPHVRSQTSTLLTLDLRRIDRALSGPVTMI
jgi:hypothetical protein